MLFPLFPKAKGAIGNHNNCTSVDTICNFAVYRNGNFVILQDPIKLKSEEKGFAIIQFVNDKKGRVMSWNLNLLRIMRKDSILINYSRFIDLNPPQKLNAYIILLDSYAKDVRLIPIKSKKDLESNCNITLKIFFKNGSD